MELDWRLKQIFVTRRINYARKSSQFDNFTDCLHHLLYKSDPFVENICERVHCRHYQAQERTTRSCAEQKIDHHKEKLYFVIYISSRDQGARSILNAIKSSL